MKSNFMFYFKRKLFKKGQKQQLLHTVTEKHSDDALLITALLTYLFQMGCRLGPLSNQIVPDSYQTRSLSYRIPIIQDPYQTGLL